MQQKQTNSSSMIWKKLEPSGKLPGDRAAHSCDLIQGKLYVFGGWNGINALQDIFSYCFQTNIWNELTSSGDIPSFRNNHTTAVYGTKLYVHGGHNGGSWLDDLYYLETQGGQALWVKAQVTGKLPTSRACHSLNRVGKNLYLFGGYDGQECFNEIEVFDLNKNSWEQPSVKGTTPTARNAHTMTRFGNKLYLFGGHSGAQHLQDLHLFDTDTLTWSEVQTLGVLPKGLRGHTSNLIQNNIYVFGGYDGSGRSNDLFIFNLLTQQWIIPNQHGSSLLQTDDDNLVLSQIPQPRQRHSATANDQDMIFIFGGFDGNKWLNDLYVLDIGLLESRTIQEENHARVILNIKNNLFNNKELSDIVFDVQGEKIYAHKVYLASQCEHFKALFYSGMKESSQSTYTIGNVSPLSFYTFLEFIYTGGILIQDLTIELQIEILGLADEYTVEGLKTLIQKHIKKMINNDTVCELLIYSQKYSASFLKNACMTHLLRNISKISGTQNYEKLKQEPSLLIEVTRAILSDAQHLTG